MKKITVLMVEDEAAIRDMLRFSLPATEFTLLDAENATVAMQWLADYIPDLILLDWMLPGKSGIDFIKWIKQQKLWKDIPIILLTAKAEEDNKIQGLMAGADDYITKPFSINELIARIKTIMRRGPLVSPTNQILMGNLALNIAKHQANIDGEVLKLTPIEYKMLYFFMTHPNITYSRDQLISHIWGGNIYIDDRTIDVQIRRLRDKLKPYGHQTRIKTVRGAGYIFSNETDEKKP